MKIKVFEAFAGYGSQAMALQRLKEDYPDFDYEVVGISEIDKFVVQAYEAVHGHCPNYGDISKIDWTQVPDFDLFTYSFPCTNISHAGRQEGIAEGSGTASSLLWECRRAIEIKRPQFLLMENVKALVGKKFIHQFNKWIDELTSYNYSSQWAVLNSKQYGIPQNRERVFLVSILGDVEYEFPKPFSLDKRLRDVIEDNVDEKYYLSDKLITSLMKDCGGVKGMRPKVTESCGVGRSRNKQGKICDIHLNDYTMCVHAQVGHSRLNMEVLVATPQVQQVGNIYPDTENFKNRTMGRVYSPDGLSPTINCCGGGDREPKIICDDTQRKFRIRKLTPRECFRLQGVRDSDIDKIQSWKDSKGKPISNSQQFKMAGNSITVDVLYYIFKNLFVEPAKSARQMSIFDVL